jgi:hypothetical protein
MDKGLSGLIERVQYNRRGPGVTVEYRICVPSVEGFHRPNGLAISACLDSITIRYC